MMLSVRRAAFGSALAVVLSASAAFAVPTADYSFTQYTGNTSTVNVHVEETSSSVLTFTLSQPGEAGALTSTIGEFRALFFSVADSSLLSGAVIAGSNVSSYVINDNAVHKVADNDTKMVGGICGGAPGCTFDVGVEIGASGQDSPIIFGTSFTYTRAAGGLSLASFFPTTGDVFGARMKPFGDGGSSKLVCNSFTGSSQNCTVTTSSGSTTGGGGGNEVPEPGALAIFGLGLLALGMQRRRK